MRLLALALAITVSVACVIPANTTSTDLPKPVIESACNVWFLGAQNVCGSAFPIASKFDGKVWRTLFVSAGHCLDRKSKFYWLRTSTGRTEIASFVINHSKFDIGLWECASGQPIKLVKTNITTPRFGDTLYAAGWPLSRFLAITVGHQASKLGCCTIYLVPGNSGGAILDMQGRAVGVARAIGAMKLEDEWHPAVKTTAYVPFVLVKKWLKQFTDFY